MKKLLAGVAICIGMAAISGSLYAESESAIERNAKHAAEIMECVPSQRWGVCVCFLSASRWYERGGFSMAIDQSGKACE